jgi:hypothetical protein
MDATSRPWYFRVFMPQTVELAYPPLPEVQTHSLPIKLPNCIEDTSNACMAHPP